MFWGCFSYDRNGPCHCYRPETKAEKERAKEQLEALNRELESDARTQWELEIKMNRLGLRNRSGKKPQ